MTPKQYKLLMFLRNHFSHTGKGPSFSLMRDLMDVNSNQTIEDWLNILERDGYIKRSGGTRRSIVLTEKTQDDKIIKTIEQTDSFKPNPIQSMAYQHVGSAVTTASNTNNISKEPIIPFNEFNKEGT